jgi:DNA-binding response OmpR family regulator
MSRTKTILLIDDDDDLRTTLAEQLDSAGEFRTAQAATATEGMAKADELRPDLILLDVHLPDMDGRKACKRMRESGVACPIVMLTGADSEADTVEGLESGANDYVAKPFRFSVLVARVRAHLRSHEQNEVAVFTIGPYEFRPSVRTLVDGKGRRIRLTDKEASILKYLYRAGASAVARDELLREVWGYNANVTTHTLETHVYRLRQKIEPDPGRATLLLTEPGGYRLQA